MSIFLLVLALILTFGVYERRLQKIRRLIGDLVQSMESNQRLLLGSDRDLAEKMGLNPLIQGVQAMMEERSRVRAKSASQMEQIETTFRNMREGVLLLDEDNRVVVSNPSADRLLNEAKSLVGKRVERFIHHPAFLDFIQQVRKSGIHGRRQIRVDLLGRTAWLEISGALMDPPSREQNEPLILFLVNDITRLKKLEGIRKDFAANVSHELRTPITIIKGFAETLHENGDQLSDEQRRSFTEKIHRNSGRLHALVEDLLSLSRLESRSLELKRELCNVQDQIRAFYAGISREENQSVELRLNLPVEPIEVELDRLFFSRILTNLVENAFKHGKTLTFVEILLRKDPENDWIDVVVFDDGVGIPEPARDRIFQRFYRVDTGHSRQTGGTGLGLSIVRHAMLAHGGNVRVEPRDPKGTQFICVFPIRSAKES